MKTGISRVKKFLSHCLSQNRHIKWVIFRMAAMMYGTFAIFSQKPILLFFAPVPERSFAWEGLLLRHPWSLGKQRSAEIPMFEHKDTHLHEHLTLQPIWQLLPQEAASHPLSKHRPQITPDCATGVAQGCAAASPTVASPARKTTPHLGGTGLY